MPKMKTKKAASKRFKVRSGGSIKRAHDQASHSFPSYDEEQASFARNGHHSRL